MRNMISGLVAAVAMVTASAVPALACGGGLFGGGCGTCGPVVSPCGDGYATFETGYGYGYGTAAFERLPDPTRYYYVNQGPAYTGPGQFAPRPYYDERAVSVYRTGTAYTGGAYAHAMTHQVIGEPSWGPVMVRYHGRHHARSWAHRYPHAGWHRGHRPHGPMHHPRY